MVLDEHLQGHVAVELEVAGLVHDPHSPRAQQLDDLVAIQGRPIGARRVCDEGPGRVPSRRCVAGPLDSPPDPGPRRLGGRRRVGLGGGCGRPPAEPAGSTTTGHPGAVRRSTVRSGSVRSSQSCDRRSHRAQTSRCAATSLSSASPRSPRLKAVSSSSVGHTARRPASCDGKSEDAGRARQTSPPLEPRISVSIRCPRTRREMLLMRLFLWGRRAPRPSAWSEMRGWRHP